MSSDNLNSAVVAVVGAGPAGIYAAKQLAAAGTHVILLNRDIKPGGLAEYGIYHNKFKMKEGLRKQFRQILELSQIDYWGNVVVGEEGDLGLADLLSAGVQAILVTVGAQGTKWLGLPGEDLKGVYHAKDLVYHYNRLPPFSTREFDVCCHVALVGVGNVMLDIAHWLIRDLKVEEVVAVARRGPAEVKFSRKEMESVARNLDLPALDDELARVQPLMEAVGQDVQAAKDFILSALPKSLEPISQTRFRFDFLASPTRILGDEDGYVCGLEIEENKLIAANGDTKARGLGTKRVLQVNKVVFCIGDRVDEAFGLPVKWNEFVKNPTPSFPVDGLSYEAYDPELEKAIPGVFVAGWSREASSGLVGVARKDGENGAKAVLQYLHTLERPVEKDVVVGKICGILQQGGHPIVTKPHLRRLDEFEQAEAQRLGLEEYKLKTNDEMLAAMGLL